MVPALSTMMFSVNRGTSGVRISSVSQEQEQSSQPFRLTISHSWNVAGILGKLSERVESVEAEKKAELTLLQRLKFHVRQRFDCFKPARNHKHTLRRYVIVDLEALTGYPQHSFSPCCKRSFRNVLCLGKHPSEKVKQHLHSRLIRSDN